jgi:Tol biopolymer transport system component/DNA-binding winged helix-turn-helix (wHTH) protein
MAQADITDRRARLLRFGPFDLNVRAGELRKHGIRITLREQPLRILLLLLERPGEVVLREEIRLKLWPNNTIVEHDHSINAAINKLRDVLGESAEKPRYIETVARRGYRFLASVEVISEASPAPAPTGAFVPPAGASAATAPTADGLEGKSISHYRVLDKLGGGGMGVVFRAEDLTLHRQIALKFLSGEYGQNPQLLERFRREARAAAALNHPNICTIYEIGEHNSQPFIAMELLQGQTFAGRLAGKPFPLNELINLAIQIANGLDAAHHSGIVHRDIKPANLFVTARGQAKILDFGLAKLLPKRAPGAAPEPAAVEVAPAPTAGRNMTTPGTPIGTASYMSPEQVRGEELDARTDLFSFGAVLYEMLSGKQAFAGVSPAEGMHAILEQDPPELPTPMPAALDRIVRRCLEKDRERRFQSAADLAFALESCRVSPPRATRPKLRVPWKWAALAVAAAAAVCAVYWLGVSARTPAANETGLRRLTADSGLTTDAAISPDGKLVAYASDRMNAGNLDIWVQPVDGGKAVRLTNDSADEYDPVFSPDGSRIAFRSEREGGGIYEVPTLGGDARLLIPKGRRPRFSPDGRFLLCWEGIGGRGSPQNSGLFVQPVSGAGTRVELSKGCRTLFSAVWSPDSRHVLFDGRCNDRQAAWLTSLDGNTREETSLNQFWQASRLLSPSLDRPYFPMFDEWAAQPPRLIMPLSAADAIYIGALPISADGMRVTGPLERLTFGTAADFRASASTGGRVVLSSASRESHIWGLPIDENGKAAAEPAQLTSGSLMERWPMLSRDGKSLTFLSGHDGYRSELYCKNLATGITSLLSPEPDEIGAQIFNADGTAVTYSTNSGIVRQVSLSGGLPEKIWDQRGLENPSLWDWSPDGKYLLFDAGKRNITSSPKFIALHDRQTLEATRFLVDPGRWLFRARFSADGHWVAFTATTYENRQQILLAPFRRELVPMSEWIPVEDGSAWNDNPIFSPDGRLLFFTSNRDGFHCIWAQRLTPDMRPSGSPFAVYHSHRSRLSLANCGLNDELKIAVGPKMIVFAQVGFTGNVWLLDPAKKPEK